MDQLLEEKHKNITMRKYVENNMRKTHQNEIASMVIVK